MDQVTNLEGLLREEFLVDHDGFREFSGTESGIVVRYGGIDDIFLHLRDSCIKPDLAASTPQGQESKGSGQADQTVIIVYTGIAAVRNDWISANQDAASLPLLVSDFYDVDDDDYIQQNSSSQTFLLGQRNVHLYGNWDIEGGGELPDLKYSITTVKLPLLYDWCKDQMYRDMDESEDDDIPSGHRNVLKPEAPSSWGAVEAYRVYNEEGWWLNRYLICYEDRIVDIRFDWEPTAEDMAIVSQKLNP